MKQLINKLRTSPVELRKHYRSINKEQVIKTATNLAVIGSICLIADEILANGTFDLGKGIKGTLEPIEKAIDDYWGRILVASTAIGYFLLPSGQDGRAKTSNAAIGLVLGGGLMLGMKAMTGA